MLFLGFEKLIVSPRCLSAGQERQRQVNMLISGDGRQALLPFGRARLAWSEYIRGTAQAEGFGGKDRQARLQWSGHVQRRIC